MEKIKSCLTVIGFLAVLFIAMAFCAPGFSDGFKEGMSSTEAGRTVMGQGSGGIVLPTPTPKPDPTDIYRDAVVRIMDDYMDINKDFINLWEQAEIYPQVMQETSWRGEFDRIVARYQRVNERVLAMDTPLEMTQVHSELRRAANLFGNGMIELTVGIDTGDTGKMARAAMLVHQASDAMQEANELIPSPLDELFD